MHYGQSAALIVDALLALVVLAGLITKGLLTRCLSFAAYLLSTCLSILFVLLWPDTFISRGSWLAIEVTLAGLRHVVALELAFHTFQAFPAARRRLRGFLWLMTAGALAAPFAVPAHLFEFDTVRGLVLPRMLYAALALFTGLGLLVLWYRLPLNVVHKAILMGLVPYLLVFSLLLNILREFGLVHLEVANLSNIGAWGIVAAFWAYVVWRQPARPVSIRR